MYQIKELGFYWLIAELNKEKNLTFGCANFNGLVKWELYLYSGASRERS